MRLRKKPGVAEAIRAFDFVFPQEAPAGEGERGRWAEIFGRQAPLAVELGTGKGDFLTQLAAKEPAQNFIGIEAEQEVLYKAARKISEAGLKNVRLLVFDIAGLEDLFLPGEIGRLYLNFCDPWPKRRHAKRRLTHRNFLAKYQRLLPAGAQLHFKTDNRALFDFSLEEFRAAGLMVQDISYDLHAENREDNIETEYERKFSALGEKICRCEVVF